MEGGFKPKAEGDEFVEEFVDDECGCGDKAAEEEWLFDGAKEVFEDEPDGKGHEDDIDEFADGENHTEKGSGGLFKCSGVPGLLGGNRREGRVLF